jgi:formylglycine-generating enzyme required for sulfatase activity
MKFFGSLLLSLILTLVATVSIGKDLPKIAVWDLTAGDINPSYAQDLTSILVSEVSKLGKYEVYSQDNVRTLAGWTAERMQLGCTDTKCLTALGQMDISKLISGRVGKIGNRYSVSLNLFDTQNAKAENAVSEFGRSEDELIELVQVAVRKLLGDDILSVAPSALVKAQPQPSSVPPAWKDFVTGIELVFIKGGCFQMGDTFGDGKSEEKPVHEVCVGDFLMGKYEVTQDQWRWVMGKNPSEYKECGGGCPVENISWKDSQEFISRLNKRTGKSLRLPTEAEWEYAARSGGKREKWGGTSIESELGEYAWYDNNSGNSTHPVGQKKPNGLGLYDMSGNVWEWCADWYDEDYYQRSSKDNPSGPRSGSFRVLRGGCWYQPPYGVRASRRYRPSPSTQYGDIGFRLAGSAR